MDQDQDKPNEAVPCTNRCGFFGQASTGNMCSKCFKESLSCGISNNQQVAEIPVSNAKEILVRERPTEKERSDEDDVKRLKRTLLACEPLSETFLPASPVKSATVAAAAAGASPSKSPAAAAVVDRSRCAECKKKVGLTGIECRCGKVYCGAHRMAEKHSCTFDFKSFGRQNIEKQNERVVAQSLVDKL